MRDAIGKHRTIAGLHILLVEDDAETATSLTALLELEGARVRTAGDGLEALRMLAEEPVDAVVSDIGMPHMDGYELMRKIRSDPAVSGVRAIALTGRNRHDEVQAAHEAGFNAHLAKPLEFQQLLDELGALTPGGRSAAGRCSPQ
ncbi:response regulator [Paraburkholderia phenoliruptrix]|uniref:response regulator n=1 Tax=Paraburkholderia phenoliruptrix TaxID=252970 RepID=UPI003D952EFE